MRLSTPLASLGLSLSILGVCAFTGPASQQPVTIIATSAPAYEPLAALRGAERFPRGAELILSHNGDQKPLVLGFAATADASVSFDAQHVLFAGKKAPSDPWSIWQITLADNSVHQVLAGATDLIRPIYLPADRMVYSRATPQGFRMETASLTGSSVVPITFFPGSAIPEDVLADGRILFQANFPLGPSASTNPVPELYLTYSDGSGVESYRCDHVTPRWAGHQLPSGDVVFTKGATLARFTSAQAAEIAIPSPTSTYDGAVIESTPGTWIVPARTATAQHFSLVRIKPGAATISPMLAIADRDIVQPVLVAPRTRPKIHPSALHPWSYANLLALDVRQSREGDMASAPATVRLETQDASGHPVLLGTAPVESDGSFFVKVRPDAPLRFALLDTDGKVVRQEHGWFWIRAGEQRICVGCHTGPERSSENRVPAVLLRTTTPVDLTTPATATNAAQSTQGSR